VIGVIGSGIVLQRVEAIGTYGPCGAPSKVTEISKQIRGYSVADLVKLLGFMDLGSNGSSVLIRNRFYFLG
jgi:hypothetical protein